MAGSDTTVPATNAQNQMLISNAVPGWTLLAAPTAEGQVPTTGADPYTPVWGTTFPTVIQFDAGLTLGGASGANIITVPDNLAQAAHLVDAGGIEYLRIVSTDAQPVVVFNEGGADVDHRWEASGHPNAIFMQGSTGFIGLNTNAPTTWFEIIDTVTNYPCMCLSAGTNGEIATPVNQSLRLGHWNAGTTTFTERCRIAATGELFINRVGGQSSIRAEAADGHMMIDSNGQTLRLNNYVADDVVLVSGGGKVSVGAVPAAVNALLELISTTGALLLTRMTTAQRNALTAVNGMIIYNSTTTAFNFYENGGWVTK